MDSENPASESEKAEQFSPDQENDIILTTNETPLLKKVDKTEDAFEVKCLSGYNEKFHRKETCRSLVA